MIISKDQKALNSELTAQLSSLLKKVNTWCKDWIKPVICVGYISKVELNQSSYYAYIMPTQYTHCNWSMVPCCKVTLLPPL